MNFLHEGGIGDVYMRVVFVLKPRESFGIAKDKQSLLRIPLRSLVGTGRLARL